MTGWRCTRLTRGGPDGPFHSHSYYDVPVFDATGRRIVAHRMSFAGRQPTPEDTIEIGLIDADRPDSWQPIGESRAWSWQQGPLAQWLGGGPRVVWNDREGPDFVARIHDTETGETRTLGRTVYGVDPAGTTGFSLDMGRLNAVRPGYGYPGGPDGTALPRYPDDDGVWRVDLETGRARLVLSLRRAARLVRPRLGMRARLRHGLAGYTYWFNHVKVAPDGRRFTVKLRWRKIGGPWNESMGVSLTCGADGDDPRLLADATSHVIWRDPEHLYFWRRGAVEVFRDEAAGGRKVGTIAPDLIDANVHIRHLDANARHFVLDTPYREEIDLLTLDTRTGTHRRIATFPGHVPRRGPFRCDLHPCPSPDGRRIVVTSLRDGGRQIYLLEATEDGDAAAAGRAG
ncbi:TolB family protein [Palleronia rufa]|uniref:TolB family protein n=1 Tax=Palleronia rufa TaxID=1530186 RepID=UPI00055D599B|nr:hypothetical protein [Palleronia rufa]